MTAISTLTQLLKSVHLFHPAVLYPLSGLDVYRTCKLPKKAARGAVALLNKYGVGQEGGKTSGSLFGE